MPKSKLSTEPESVPARLDEHRAFAKAARRAKRPAPKSTHSADTKTPPAGQEAPAKPDPEHQAGFFMDPDGLFYIAKKGDAFLPAAWVCAHFRVVYRGRGLDGLRWRIVLAITDRDGKEREVTLFDAEVSGPDGSWHKALADAGLKIHPRRRGELGQYLLLECDRAPRVGFVETTGWHRRCYAMPHRTIGQEHEPILFQSQGGEQTVTFSESGTAQEWREHVGRYCAGNSRLILAACAGFAATVLPFSEIHESGGWHLFGASSLGKTTALRVASSLHGRPSQYMSTWRATGNALEGIAARYNHACLPLDEISQAEQQAGASVMMLANQMNKGRMSDAANLKRRITWQLFWLSTGEHAMSHYMEAANLRPDPGMEVRQLDIPADAGRGLGLFEELHGQPSARDLAEHLRAACDQYHGAVGVLWLEQAAARLDELKRDLPGEVRHVAASFTPPGAESQVMRALRRFALCAVAGEYATAWGLTGWQPGQASAGIKACVDAWLLRRGGPGNLEARRMVQRLQDFLSKHWSGRFVAWDRADDSHAPGKDGVVGLRRQIDDAWEFYITAPGWAEIYRGLDPVAAAHTLAGLKLLEVTAKGEPNRREYLPGYGRVRCYRPVAEFFRLSDSGGGDE